MQPTDHLPNFPTTASHDAIAECLTSLAKASIAAISEPGPASSAIVDAVATARRHFPEAMDHAEARERTTYVLHWLDALAGRGVFVDPMTAGYEFHVQSPARWGGFTPTLAVSLLIALDGCGVRITAEAPSTLHDGESISISIVDAGEIDTPSIYHGTFSSLMSPDVADFVFSTLTRLTW